MKSIVIGIASLFALANSLFAVDVDGIKVANLKDANLELMGNHDPASELENFVLLPGYEVNLFAAADLCRYASASLSPPGEDRSEQVLSPSFQGRLQRRCG